MRLRLSQKRQRRNPRHSQPQQQTASSTAKEDTAMKHTLTLLASLAAVVGSTAVAVNVHRAQVQHQLVLDAKVTAVQAQQVAQEQAQAHQNALKLQQDEASLK